MKQTVIKINGVDYPVVFDLLALSNFEEITDKGFFEANLNKINNRMAIVMSAVLSADKDAKLTIEEMRGKESFGDYKQIVEAYNIVMTLANDFFKIPEVEKNKDPKPEEQSRNKRKTQKTEYRPRVVSNARGRDRNRPPCVL